MGSAMIALGREGIDIGLECLLRSPFGLASLSIMSSADAKALSKPVEKEGTEILDRR